MSRIASGLVLLLVGPGAFAETILDHDPSNQEIAGKRNLKLYADGGNFGATTVGQGAIPNIAALRDFIWSHWKERTRGYVRLVISGTDSTVTVHIFIEPGRRGASHIRWRGVNRWSEGARIRRIFGNWSDAVLLERAQPIEHDSRGGDYVLIFKAKDRKELWRL